MAAVAVIGVGYVGLTTAVGLASLGHDVVGLDTNATRVAALTTGKSPIYEPGLDEVLHEVLAAGRLTFTDDYAAALGTASFVFLCLPTPQDQDGSADMAYVLSAASAAGPHLRSGAVVVTKSTVPVGSSDRVAAALGRHDVEVASNPEFLREGSAVDDFMHPERIVVGARTPEVAQAVADLYHKLGSPVVATTLPAAELIKYASNTFLAVKLSFVNDIAALCAATGADADAVLHGMGLDSRIGAKFLRPGPGWGGSCFPKDARALNALASELDVPMPLVHAAIDSNARARARVVGMVADGVGGALAGKRIAAWGLAFKANTDDVRESPALAVIHDLVSQGAHVVAHDPVAHVAPHSGFEQADSALDAVRGAHALVVLTEWPDYATVSATDVLAAMSGNSVVDARGILHRQAYRDAGAAIRNLG